MTAPTDADFDDMHHALGRPAGAHVQPYRNYFCCAADGPDAARFAELDAYWVKAGPINRGADAVFHVTAEGQRAVMAWLEARARSAGIRRWIVMGDGLTTRTVMAKSRSAARFSVYAEISDVWGGGFREFLKLDVRVLAS